MKSARNVRIIISTLLIAAGMWLVLSPLIMTISGGALWSQLAAGIVLIGLGGYDYMSDDRFPDWAATLVGVWLLLSPFVFNVSTSLVQNWVVSGIITILLALVDGVTIEEPQQLS